MLMDFLIELLTEVITDGLGNAIDHPKIPIWISLLVHTVLCLLLIAVFILLIYAACQEKDLPGIVIYGIIIAGLTALWTFGCVKIVKGKRENKNK
jgi:hypothetical protein